MRFFWNFGKLDFSDCFRRFNVLFLTVFRHSAVYRGFSGLYGTTLGFIQGVNDQWQKLGGFEVLEVDVFTVVASPYRPINNPYVIFTVTTVARLVSQSRALLQSLPQPQSLWQPKSVAVTATTR